MPCFLEYSSRIRTLPCQSALLLGPHCLTCFNLAGHVHFPPSDTVKQRVPLLELTRILEETNALDIRAVDDFGMASST